MKKKVGFAALLGIVMSGTLTGCFFDPKIKELPVIENASGVYMIDTSLATKDRMPEADEEQNVEDLDVSVLNSDGLVDLNIPAIFFERKSVDKLFPFLVSEEIMVINEANGSKTFRMTPENYLEICDSIQEDLEEDLKDLKNMDSVVNAEYVDDVYREWVIELDADSVSEEIKSLAYDIYNASMIFQIVQGDKVSRIKVTFDYMDQNGNVLEEESYLVSDWY